MAWLITGDPFSLLASRVRSKRASADSTGNIDGSCSVPSQCTMNRATVVKWYGTNADIEDRRRAEEALRASEQDLA